MSDNYMLSKKIKQNIRYLKTLGRNAGANQDQIDNLISLYEERKISHMTTAENAILSLKTASNPRQVKTAVKRYDKIVTKYAKNEPLNVRLQRKKPVVYQLKVILFQRDETQDRKKGQRRFKGYNVLGPPKDYKVQAIQPFPHPIKEMIERYLDDGEYFNEIIRTSNKVFADVVKMLLQDETFKDLYEQHGESYIDAVYIVDATILNLKPKRSYNPVDEELRDGAKVSMYSKYIETNLDLSFDTFKDAIKNKCHKVNECWINAITDVYGDTLMAENKRKPLTREIILKIIGKTEETVKQGIKLNDILPLFKEYRIQLRVFDAMGKLIYKYNPEKRNSHNKVFYCQIKGDHIYTLNHDLKTLEQKLDADPSYVVKASDNYYLSDSDEIHQYKMIESVDDIVALTKQFIANEEKVMINLVCKNDNLLKLLWDLKYAGYCPSVKYEAGAISRVGLTCNNVLFMIQSQQLVKHSLHGNVCLDSEETYNKLNGAMGTFNKSLFKKEHKSFFTSQDIDILDEYRTVVPIGVLDTEFNDLTEIDVTKAFTNALAQITEVPIFNEFDYFQDYNNQRIEDLTLYIIETSKANIFFNKRYCVVYGKFLKSFVNDVKIIGYKQPSSIKSVTYKDIVEQLYKTTISDDELENTYLRKLIANVNIGLLEKSHNKAQKTFLFDTEEEAFHYQAQYGGNISVLKKFNDVIIEEEEDYDPLDQGIETLSLTTSTKQEWEEDERKFYLLNITDKCKLKNGFRYIKELLLQHHNYEMFTTYKTLTDNGINVFTVKTDAYTINTSDVSKANKLLNFDNKIGSWRISIEETKHINLPSKDYELVENNFINIKPPTFEMLSVNNEYDKDELCQLFEEKKRVMIRADLPGSGKSSACEHMATRGHSVLFVCPTNVLAQKFTSTTCNENTTGCTINKFFSIGMSEDSRMAKFDDSPYDVIVFDEIYFSSLDVLTRIKHYSESNPDKIILATGDTCQLEPIKELSNAVGFNEYSDQCINVIFQYGITLKENKRLKSEEDKHRLKQAKQDIFNKMPRREFIKKYFKFTSNMSQSDRNVALTNETTFQVVQQIRKSKGIKQEYQVGEKLICKVYHKDKKLHFNVNYQYSILRVSASSLTIQDISSNETFDVPIDIIRTKFMFNYCQTCHSLQGSSIDKSITIFDWGHHFVDAKWLWTAVTRATELNNVYFYDYTDKGFNEDALTKYFNKKLNGYIYQDTKAKRVIDKDNYITVEWMMNAIKCPCRNCGNEFDISMPTPSNINVKTNFTAQREDNSKAHHLDNIKPFCILCNTSLSNK